MSHELQLLVALIIIITACKLAGHISARYLRQPVVFGEIMVGLLLGPSFLNMLNWDMFASSSAWLSDHLHVFASLGVLLLMFTAGLETDLTQMRKVGKTALWSAVCGVIFPLVLGFTCCRMFGLGIGEGAFVGTVLVATSVSISAQTLMELRAMQTPEGMTILGAAVIDDILGIIVLSVVIAFAATMGAGQLHFSGLAPIMAGEIAHLSGIPNGPALAVGSVFLLMTLFFVVSMLLGRKFHGVIHLADRLHSEHTAAAGAIVLMLVFAVMAEVIGQVAAITGAYLVGVFLSQSGFREEIESSVKPMMHALFVPVFFASIGLGADIHLITAGILPFALSIVAIALVTKVVGCGLGARLSGFNSQQSLRVGIGMISRGEVGLIVAQVGLSAGVIGKPEYASMILMVLVSTVVTPVLLRMVFPKPVETPNEPQRHVATVVPEASS